jgi:hypothetical protein
MRRSESEQRILRSFKASRAGCSQDKSERKGDGGVCPREVKCLASRLVLCSSTVAYTVGERAFEVVRGEKKHTRRGENNSLTSNEASVHVFIRFRDKLLYCRTMKNES